MANLTATCPELAPPGWHLYVAYAVPIPALGDFDSGAEVELALADLREQFPNFNQARILSTRVMRDDWPALNPGERWAYGDLDAGGNQRRPDHARASMPA